MSEMVRLSPQEIDAIVRDVMRQLGVPSDADVTPQTTSACACAMVRTDPNPKWGTVADATNAGGTSTGGAGRSSGEVVAETKTTQSNMVYRVVSKLVTLETLPELTGIRTLEVPARAIVTPAVVDELRRHGVTLVYVKSGTTQPVANSENTAGETGVGAAGTVTETLVAVVLSRFTGTDGLQKTVRQLGMDVIPYTGNCLIQATDDFSATLAGRGRLGVLVTDHPAAAICLMNRRRGLRAIQATARGAEVVARDAAAVGANLLVVDPREAGFWAMRQTVVRFLKSGPYPVPKALCTPLD